jgi:hypothetical protein
MTEIAGVFGRNAMPNIYDCRGFLNRSQINYDRRKTNNDLGRPLCWRCP